MGLKGIDIPFLEDSFEPEPNRRFHRHSHGAHPMRYPKPTDVVISSGPGLRPNWCLKWSENPCVDFSSGVGNCSLHQPGGGIFGMR